MQATITTPRLTLVPLNAAHVSLIETLDTDARVMAYIERTPLLIHETHADHAARIATRLPVPGLGHWVGLLENAVEVGWWSIVPCDDGVAELGYRLRPEYWRKGLAKEGMMALLKRGFEKLDVKEVFGQTMAVNKASRATMAACGLKYVRTFYLHFDDPIPGTEEGEVEYRLTKDEWLQDKYKSHDTV